MQKIKKKSFLLRFDSKCLISSANIMLFFKMLLCCNIVNVKFNYEIEKIP
jgi:hypothetical protein